MQQAFEFENSNKENSLEYTNIVKLICELDPINSTYVVKYAAILLENSK